MALSDAGELLALEPLESILPEHISPGAQVELEHLAVDMLKVDMLLEGLELVSRDLADAACPATLGANDHPVAALPAALLLVHLQLALGVEGLVAELAPWSIPSFRSWRLSQDRTDHWRCRKIIGEVNV